MSPRAETRRRQARDGKLAACSTNSAGHSRPLGIPPGSHRRDGDQSLPGEAQDASSLDLSQQALAVCRVGGVVLKVPVHGARGESDRLPMQGLGFLAGAGPPGGPVVALLATALHVGVAVLPDRGGVVGVVGPAGDGDGTHAGRVDASA